MNLHASIRDTSPDVAALNLTFGSGAAITRLPSHWPRDAKTASPLLWGFEVSNAQDGRTFPKCTAVSFRFIS